MNLKRKLKRGKCVYVAYIVSCLQCSSIAMGYTVVKDSNYVYKSSGYVYIVPRPTITLV